MRRTLDELFHRLDEQAQALEATMGQGDAGVVQAAGEPIERTRRNPRATRGPLKGNAGSRVAPSPPRKKMVELRRVELDRCSVSAKEDELLNLPSSRRGRR